MRVTFYTNDNKTSQLLLSDADTVEEVLIILEAELGLPHDELQLVFNGAVIAPGQTIKAAGVTDMSRVLVSRRTAAVTSPVGTLARPTKKPKSTKLAPLDPAVVASFKSLQEITTLKVDHFYQAVKGNKRLLDELLLRDAELGSVIRDKDEAEFRKIYMKRMLDTGLVIAEGDAKHIEVMNRIESCLVPADDAKARSEPFRCRGEQVRRSGYSQTKHHREP